MNRIIFTLCLLAFAATALSACNTAEGFGKDMSQAGDAIQGVFN